MQTIRRLMMLLVLALGAPALTAQDEDGAAGDPPAAEPSEAPEMPAEQSQESSGAAAERARGDEDVFVPTEELSADEEVTFPVDI